MGGLTTTLLAGVLIAGAFFGLRWWEAKQTPPPPPDFEPATNAAGLAKPGALPGAARKEEEPASGDSLSMVRPAADYSGVSRGGPMVNSRPEPPLSYAGDEGSKRAETRVVKTKKDWDALWRETGGHDMPFVDFERWMGLVVFAGERPAGSKVVIAAGKPEGGRLEVRWRLVPPQAPAAGVTRPFAAILVPKTTASPVFRESRG